MKKKTINNQEFLTFCSWQTSKECVDKGMTIEYAKHIAEKVGIDIGNISHGICQKCKVIVELEAGLIPEDN